MTLDSPLVETLRGIARKYHCSLLPGSLPVLKNGLVYNMIPAINKEGMIIENFKNVKENHLVQVIFTEKPIEVPITGRKTKLIIAAILVVIVNVFIAIKTGFVSKMFKKSL